MKYRRYLLWFILLLVIGLPLSIYGLLATEAGTRWLLQQVAERTRSAEFSLQLGRVEGNLLHQLSVQNVQIKTAAEQVLVDRMVLRWNPASLRHFRLHIHALELSGVRTQIEPATGSAQPLTLPDIRLPVTIQLDKLRVDQLLIRQGDTKQVFQTITFGAQLTAAQLALKHLSVQGNDIDLTGAISLEPQPPHRLDGQLAGRLTLPDIGPIQADFKLTGSALQPKLELRTSAPAKLRLTGSTNLSGIEPTFKIDARWPQLNWPLQGPALVNSSDGQLQLSGSLSHYKLRLAAQVQQPGYPPMQLQLSGQGDSAQLRLAPLRLHSPAGSLTADGEIRWQPQFSWQLSLKAKALNTALLLPEWPSALNGQLQAHGRLTALGPQLDFRNIDISGTLRDQPMRASGEISYQAGQLLAKSLAVSSGPNQLQMNGIVGDQLDLTFNLQAPDLTALHPGLAGTLQGQGKFTGTTLAPAIKGLLSGKALSYDKLRLETLQLEADWATDRGEAKLDIQGAGYDDELLLEAANANLSGTQATHRLNVAIESPHGVANLSATGGLQAERWHGTLQQLALTEPWFGRWTLKKPATLILAEQRINSSPLCLHQHQSDAHLCIEGGWNQAQGLDTRGELAGLQLAPLGKQLLGEADISGQLAAQLKLTGPLENPSVDLALRPSSGLLTLMSDEAPLQIPYRNASVNLQVSNDQLKTDFKLQLGQNGYLNGQVALGQAPERALNGQIEATFPDLRLVEGFIPTLEAVEGRLQMQMGLSGFLEQPHLKGKLHILDGRARLPSAGLELTDARLEIRSNEAGPLAIDGGVTSGSGRLNLSGTLQQPPGASPTIDLTITGQNFLATNLPEAVVEITPQLHLTGKRPYHLSGRLEIPNADIRVKELPAGSVSVSKDEIVVGETAASDTPELRSLTAAVRITLGKAVSFKGFGLTTDLSGTLRANVDKRSPRLQGKINLRNAKYRAYGQRLTVEQGRLLFAGRPDNPDLDLKAVRLSRNRQVKAYLAINGTLDNPHTRIYSEPTLPEAEALAYLLTGRGLEQAGPQEGTAIAGAALSLGLSRGEPLLQKMGDRLGLDELRIEDQGQAAGGSALILGKYLNPDLYLGYAQSLFDPQGSVLLRLRLTDRLNIESRAGTEQSIDLFYRLEHD